MAVTLPKGERVDWRDLELEVAHLSVGGLAITSTEIGYLDGITLGTGAASKAVVLTTGEDYTWPSTGILTYGVLKDSVGTTITTTADEINDLDHSVRSTIFEDFHGVWVDTEEQPVKDWLVGVGGGTTPIKATTVAGSKNGEVTMKSATTDGIGSAVTSLLTGANLGWSADKGGLSMEARLKIDTIDEAYIFVGFTDALASTKEEPVDFTDGSDTAIATANNACGLVFSGDATTQEFHTGGVKATAVTAAAFSGVAPANDTYIVLRVDVSAAGAVTGYINGTVTETVAAAITAATAITPAVIVGSKDASQVIMTLDYIKVSQNR